MSKNNGGSAYPTTERNREAWGGGRGMSLRDHFAGLAMQGFCADPTSHKLWSSHGQMAVDAYATADAMLAAREAK